MRKRAPVLRRLATVVGITNLWAQSGMQARAVTLLGAFPIVYDLIATSLTPLMGTLLERLAAQPLGPHLAWPLGHASVVAIGVGDVLVTAVFPLVLRRAFGEWAGMVAMGSAIGAMVGLSLLPLSATCPVMVVLGPLMALQYAVWRWRYGSERTTYQYLTEVRAHQSYLFDAARFRASARDPSQIVERLGHQRLLADGCANRQCVVEAPPCGRGIPTPPGDGSQRRVCICDIALEGQRVRLGQTTLEVSDGRHIPEYTRKRYQGDAPPVWDGLEARASP